MLWRNLHVINGGIAMDQAKPVQFVLNDRVRVLDCWDNSALAGKLGTIINMQYPTTVRQSCLVEFDEDVFRGHDGNG
jgi:hypothetical protein